MAPQNEIIILNNDKQPAIVTMNFAGKFVKHAKFKVSRDQFMDMVSKAIGDKVGLAPACLIARAIRSITWKTAEADGLDGMWIEIDGIRFVPATNPDIRSCFAGYHVQQHQFCTVTDRPDPYIQVDEKGMNDMPQRVRNLASLIIGPGDHMFQWNSDYLRTYSRQGLDELNHDGWADRIVPAILDIWTTEIKLRKGERQYAWSNRPPR